LTPVMSSDHTCATPRARGAVPGSIHLPRRHGHSTDRQRAMREAALRRAYDERLALVRQRLAACLADPRKESIHVMRTSIRRLESGYRVLRPACASPQAERFMHALRAFFRQNSVVRDCDILREKFLAQDVDADDPLFTALAARRAAHLKIALAQAASLARFEAPVLHPATANAEASHARVTGKLARRILSQVPAARAGSASMEAIHELRKDAKKLFYLLELDETPARQAAAAILKLLLRLAGELQDSEVAIAFLREHLTASPHAKPLLQDALCAQDVLRQEVQELIGEYDWPAVLLPTAEECLAVRAQ